MEIISLFIEKALRYTFYITGGMLVTGLAANLIIGLGRKVVSALFPTRASRAGLIFRLFTFTGVLFHELYHALFAILTGAAIKSIHISIKNGDGNTEVYLRGNDLMQSVQQSVSAMGPVLGGMASVYLLCFIAYPLKQNILYHIFIIYLAVSIFLHSDMSRQDMKVWLRGLPGFLIFLFACCLAGLLIAYALKQ